jgi:hypothetical protein
MERLTATESASVSVIRGSGRFTENANATGVYTATCFGTDGQEKWSETFDNLVTTQGKNYLLNNGITGSAYTNIKYMSLITAGGSTATDTYATPGTTVEVGASVIAARLTVTFTASTANSLATTTAVSFSIGASATVTGCMLVMVANTIGALATRGDTTTSGAVLYSSGTFTSKTVASGDTLNVSYTASL